MTYEVKTEEIEGADVAAAFAEAAVQDDLVMADIAALKAEMKAMNQRYVAGQRPNLSGGLGGAAVSVRG